MPSGPAWSGSHAVNVVVQGSIPWDGVVGSGPMRTGIGLLIQG